MLSIDDVCERTQIQAAVLQLVEQLHSAICAMEELNQALNALSPGLREEIDETLRRLREG